MRLDGQREEFAWCQVFLTQLHRFHARLCRGLQHRNERAPAGLPAIGDKITAKIDHRYAQKRICGGFFSAAGMSPCGCPTMSGATAT